MLLIKFLSIFVFILSLWWFIAQPDYEPAIAMITSLLTLSGASLSETKMKRQPNQKQIVGKNSIGIQAGGDASAENIRVSIRTKDVE